MIYDWYKIFNKTEFEDTGLVSRTLTLYLDGVGDKEVLVTKANELGVVYEDVFLRVNFNNENPYTISPYAVFLDTENQDVYLGIEVPEET